MLEILLHLLLVALYFITTMAVARSAMGEVFHPWRYAKRWMLTPFALTMADGAALTALGYIG